MMFLHTLRLAGDLSFYYAFAGFFCCQLRWDTHAAGAGLACPLLWSGLLL